MTCFQCGRTLSSDEIAVYRRLVNRAAEQCLCISCFAKEFSVTEELIRAEHPQSLCLGAGGCTYCKTCAYPEPCRFPDKAFSSMEGYGLFVTQVCKDSGLPYYYGEKTITYTACALF